ncbi:MAG: DUF4384 domain-containing protein [Candidatus Zixiibacteriota bacterium]
MLRKTMIILMMTAFGLVTSASLTQAQNISREYDNDTYPEHEYDYDRARIDRYLDVEVWVNHADNEYCEGDRIVISYRANRDAFVVIYGIDTRGRVNLLFPSYPGEDNFVRGGVTYHLPSAYDDFDLVVSGPEGVEHIQAIASRDRFPIPDWHPASGLVYDWDDPFEYMDYLNERFFVRYGGQRFAYDRTAIYVYEWEPYYFRPVYYPRYYPWTLCGNVYIDYPFGATIYIDGIYWGCAPLYIPRVYVGWHTITIYDYYGWCWEHDFHITRYHTVVLGHDVIRTSPTVVSKYKEVRFSGYRNPVSSGYPEFETKKKAIMTSGKVGSVSITRHEGAASKKTETVLTLDKKFVRGSTELVKTERGYETTGSVYGTKEGTKPSYPARPGDSRLGKSKGSISTEMSRSLKKPTISVDQTSRSGSKKAVDNQKTGRTSESSSGYYRKKSGSEYKGSAKLRRIKTESTKSSESKKGKQTKSFDRSKESGTSYMPSKATDRKSGGSKKSSGTYHQRGSGAASKAAGISVRPSPSTGKSGASSGSKRVSGGGKDRR